MIELCSHRLDLFLQVDLTGTPRPGVSAVFYGFGNIFHRSRLPRKTCDNLYSSLLCPQLEGVSLAAGASGMMTRKNTVRKILRNLEGTTEKTAKTRQEINVGIFQVPILDSLVDKEVEDEQGRRVKVKKILDGRYYLEKA